MITFDCALCGNPIVVPKAYVGRRIKCLKCCKPARVPPASQRPTEQALPRPNRTAAAMHRDNGATLLVDEPPRARLDWQAVRGAEDLPPPLKQVLEPRIRKPRVPTFRWFRWMGGAYTCVGLSMLALGMIVWFIMPAPPKPTAANVQVTKAINTIYIAGALVSAALFLAVGQVLYGLRDIARTYRRAR